MVEIEFLTGPLAGKRGNVTSSDRHRVRVAHDLGSGRALSVLRRENEGETWRTVCERRVEAGSHGQRTCTGCGMKITDETDAVCGLRV